MTKKARPGSPIAGVIKASTWNDVEQMVERDKRRSRQEAGPIELPGVYPVIVSARPTNAASLRRGSWCAITEPAFAPDATDDPKLPDNGGPWQFRDGHGGNQVLNRNTSPTTAASRDCPMMALDRRQSATQAGRFLAAGMCRTQIHFPAPVSASAYRRRYRTAGFESGVATNNYVPVARNDNQGPLKILWHENPNWTEAGLQWAIVHFPHFGGYNDYDSGATSFGGAPNVILDGGITDWKLIPLIASPTSIPGGHSTHVDDLSVYSLGAGEVGFRRSGSRMVHVRVQAQAGTSGTNVAPPMAPIAVAVRVMNATTMLCEERFVIPTGHYLTWDGSEVTGLTSASVGRTSFAFTFRGNFGPSTVFRLEAAASFNTVIDTTHAARVDFGPVSNMSL